MSKHGKPPAGPIAGNFAPAPAGAPKEVSQPLGPDAIAQQVGLSILLMLMVGAIFNDVSRFF